MRQRVQAALRRPGFQRLAAGQQSLQRRERRIEPESSAPALLSRPWHQALSCKCASRNQRYLSISREIPVNRSAVSASPSSSVSVNRRAHRLAVNRQLRR